MTPNDPLLWVLLYLCVYATVLLYWSRLSAPQNSTARAYFTADGDMPGWVMSLALVGSSLSGLVVLGFPQMIASQGLGFAPLASAGIFLPLVGVLLFKRQWEIARRYSFLTQGALLNGYYGGQALGRFAALVALIFAVGFVGLQLRALGDIASEVFGSPQAQPAVIWSTAALVAAYVVIGGMRAVGFIGGLQTVLIAIGISGIAALVLIQAGGFAALNSILAAATMGGTEPLPTRLEVAGVIQFVSGVDTGQASGHIWTAVLITTFALSLIGVQTSPMVTQLVLSMRTTQAIARGQTWLFAGVFGFLIVFAIVAVGVSGIGVDAPVLSTGLTASLMTSPWFVGVIALGVIAAVQIVSAGALIAAAGALIRDVYVPHFHTGLEERGQILFARVLVVVLLIATCLLATLSPVALSAFGALALPLSLQLAPALLGLCWVAFFTRQGVVTGLLFGMFAVFVTETAGHATFAFLGLELPWSRWPWTIHSGGWGLAVNMLCVLIVSTVTGAEGQSDRAAEMRGFVRRLSAPVVSRTRGLKSAGWSAVLAWTFMAVGPGLIFGNTAFGTAADGMAGWSLGMPSIWAWTVLFWIIGVLLIWFLAFRVGLAISAPVEVTPIAQGPTAPVRNTGIKDAELIRLMWAVSVAAATVAAVAWTFGP